MHSFGCVWKYLQFYRICFQVRIKLGPVPRDASSSLEHTKCACRKAFMPLLLHSAEGGKNPQKLKCGKNKKTSPKVLMLPKRGKVVLKSKRCAGE